MKTKNSLSTKILFMVEIILLITSILFCTVSVTRARVDIRRAIQQRMLDIANCASGSVNGDVLEALTESDIGSAEYDRVYDTLAVFRDNVELEYVYCIRDLGGGDFIFLMDTDPVNPGGYGDSVKFTQALSSAARGKAAVDEVPYSDAWGEFYSAYSPVFDSGGNVAGIIAVDFSADWFDSQLSAQTRSTVVSYAVILLLSLLVAAILSMVTVRPFVRLQAQLLEEKVSADSANKAKSAFLTGMSHEIRTPINTILGMNEMISRESADESILGYSGSIRQAGKALLSMVDSILDFAKIEDGKIALGSEPYDTTATVEALLDSVRERAEAKSLELTAEVDENLPAELRGDGRRVSQIIQNLLTNAVKYTERGGVTLTLRDAGRENGRVALFVSVRDTGVGIRAEEMGKLTASFERLGELRYRSIEGAGLGLAIVTRLLAMMDSRLHVESVYGEGSEFSFTILQDIADETPVGDFSARLRPGAQELRPGEYLYAPEASVLIVDDNEMNLRVARNLMKRNGIEPVLASSGKEAVAQIRERVFDIVFLDHMMPEMDGIETLALLRSEHLLSERTTVVALTANAVAGARETYLSAGFDDYLTKPVEVHALERMLAEYLPAEKQSFRSDRAAPSPAGAQPGGADGGEVLEFLPDDGVMEFEPADGEPGAEGAGDEQTLQRLRDAQLSVDDGLRYCGGDTGFYLDVIGDFAKGGAKNCDALQSSFDERDWKNYQIRVHMLKSATKTIGARELSEAARALEEAAGTQDAAFLEAHHGALLRDYGAICRRIGEALPSG